MKFFLLVILVSATAYLPLSAIYPPWQYAGFGPFETQPSLAPQYVIYFFAGVVVGALRYERGSLDLDIMLARRWGVLLLGTLASFALWIGPIALIVNGRDSNATLRSWPAWASYYSQQLPALARSRWPSGSPPGAGQSSTTSPRMPMGFTSFIILSYCGSSICFLASLFPPLPRAWSCSLPR